MSKAEVDNQQVLDIVYKIVDDLEYKVENDVVTVMFKQDHKIQKFFRKIKFKIPEYKNVELDEYCSFVFNQIDGIKTIGEIGEILSEKFGEEANPLYERLLLFLNHIEVNEKYIEKV